MKNFQIGSAFVLAIFFTACGAHYNSEPSQRLTDQQGHWELLHPGDAQQTLVHDSVYKMEPTWWQAVQWAKKDGTYKWFWILLLLGPAAGYAIYYFATRSQPAKPWLFFVILVVWGVFWVGAYTVLDSKKWSSDQLFPKSTVDSLLRTDGDLHAAWQKVKPI